MKKMVSLVLVGIICVMALAACGGKKSSRIIEETVDAETTESADSDKNLSGGWEVSEKTEITAELKNVFDKATETLTGAEYTPVAYLGSQVVAGTNHAFLCQEKPSVKELETTPTWTIVYIYENLDGECEIINTQAVNLGI